MQSGSLYHAEESSMARYGNKSCEKLLRLRDYPKLTLQRDLEMSLFKSSSSTSILGPNPETDYHDFNFHGYNRFLQENTSASITFPTFNRCTMRSCSVNRCTLKLLYYLTERQVVVKIHAL
jgi:hypothetical protein